MIKKVVVKKRKYQTPPSIIKAEKKTAAHARELMALDLYLKGLTSEEIGEALTPPCDAIHAQKLISRAIESEKSSRVPAVRSREELRLDRLFSNYWVKANGYTDEDGVIHAPDAKFARLCLDFIETNTRIHGLNAPVEYKLVEATNEILNVVQRVAPDKFGEIIAEIAKLNSSATGGDITPGTTGVPPIPAGLPN